MAVEINITKKERVYINPDTNEQLPRIQKGTITTIDLGKDRNDEENGKERGNN